MHAVVGGDNLPRAAEHQAEGQIGHSVGVGALHVTDHDALRLSGLHRDVIQTRAMFADDFKLFAGCQHLGREIVRADNQRVIVRNLGVERLLVKILASGQSHSPRL
ncbi:hypothetical protein SDC9_190340 [bioreactor metagenome]|uniref:Uncharacterized protein n=1 Tax=bioreactor metagenome TaxID=1076179 RepID=A0A645HWE4_9ZZZZ